MPRPRKIPIFERYSPDGRLLGFQVKIRRFGFPPVSKQFDERPAAERFATAILAEMDAGTFTDRREVERTTLREALEQYVREVCARKKSGADEEYTCRRWMADPLAARSVAALQARDFSRYRDDRLAEGMASRTVQKELAVIRHLFNVGRKDWGWPIQNPVEAIRMPSAGRGRDRRLEPSEEEKLLPACRDGHSRWLEWLVKLAIATAMRQGELLALKARHVDFDARTAFLPETKNGESRTVPLSGAAYEILWELIAQMHPGRNDDRVFPITRTISHAFGRACARAGIEGLRFHDLRHEATSRLFELGLNMQEVAAITGHKTLQMLKRYTHLRAEDLARRLDRNEN